MWSCTKYYPGTSVKELIKITKDISQDIRAPVQDLNPAPPEFEGAPLDHDVVFL
jgi:hypothetical protein